MNLFIIGDVHGCWYTYQKLLQHWNRDTEILVQVGDLMDRGYYSNRCIDTSRDLHQEYPDSTVFLKGNHEHMMIKFLEGVDTRGHWIINGGKETLESYEREAQQPEESLSWLKDRPLYWETESVFISHAGISWTDKPLDENNHDGVLWNRGLLKDLGKVQIIGHTPQMQGKATNILEPPSWNVDTGAYRGLCLTGIKLTAVGKKFAEINVPTDNRDIR